MDSTSTATGCLLSPGAHRQSYAEIADVYGMNPPIYATLVVEWWARGRTVPGRHDAQWAILAAPPTTGTPDGTESGIGTVRWERVAVSWAGTGRGG
jgi:hypothetical protein